MLREDNVIQRVLSETEEQQLLRFSAPHVRRVVICALDSGLRLNEILSLSWECVDFQNGFITVTKTKTGRSREVPISQRLRNVLHEVAKQSQIGHVFRHSNGKPIKSVKEGFKIALSKADLEAKKIRFHDLRHAFATRLAEKGVSLFTIKELLGHSTIITTQRYAHPGRRAKRAAITCLDDTTNKSGP